MLPCGRKKSNEIIYGFCAEIGENFLGTEGSGKIIEREIEKFRTCQEIDLIKGLAQKLWNSIAKSVLRTPKSVENF